MTGQLNAGERIYPTSHKEWLAYRKLGLGGSDIGAIMGLSNFKSPIDIYYDKTNPETKEEKPSVVMRRGQYLEPLVVELFKEKYGYEVVHNKEHEILVHHTENYLFGTNDGTILKDNTQGTLECKTAAGRGSIKWQQGIPYEYLIQTQHYMDVYNHDWGYIAWFIDDIYGDAYIERDDNLITSMHYMAKDFWNNHVLKNVPPDASTLSDYKQIANRMTCSGSFESNEAFIDLLNEYTTLKDMINDGKEYTKGLETQKDNVEYLIRKKFGERDIAYHGEDEIATCKLTKAGARKLWLNTKLINSLKEENLS